MKNLFVNKKIVLGGMTMLLILAIIIVSSFFPFILDFSNIGTEEFITDQLIIVAITISTTVSMMFMSQASNGQNPKSEIAKAKVLFEMSIKKIVEHTAFYQWVKRVLQPSDRKDIAEKGMLKLGVDFKVWDLSDSEIKRLTAFQTIDGINYKALTKNQIQGVLKLRKRVKSIRFVAPNYYTSYKSYANNKNLSEIASTENLKKISTVMFQLFIKITFTLIFASIFASLVRDLTQDGGNTAQAWIRFFSRMFAFVSSSYLGYMLGCKLNDLDAFYIIKRVEAHTLFLEDKNFKPINEQETLYNFMEKQKEVSQVGTS